MRVKQANCLRKVGGGGGGRKHKGNLAANRFGFILIGWEGGVNLRVIYSEDTPMRPRI